MKALIEFKQPALLFTVIYIYIYIYIYTVSRPKSRMGNLEEVGAAITGHRAASPAADVRTDKN